MPSCWTNSPLSLSLSLSPSPPPPLSLSVCACVSGAQRTTHTSANARAHTRRLSPTYRHILWRCLRRRRCCITVLHQCHCRARAAESRALTGWQTDCSTSGLLFPQHSQDQPAHTRRRRAGGRDAGGGARVRERRVRSSCTGRQQHKHGCPPVSSRWNNHLLHPPIPLIAEQVEREEADCAHSGTMIRSSTRVISQG